MNINQQIKLAEAASERIFKQLAEMPPRADSSISTLTIRIIDVKNDTGTIDTTAVARCTIKSTIFASANRNDI